MCRLLAYGGTPIFLDTLLERPEGSLISQSRAAREAKTVVNGDGCGLGWYGEREEPGLYRAVQPAWSDANLVSLCRQIRSGLFLAHVRAATSGGVSTNNCHPFANGRHLFVHNGQIGNYARHRRAVEAMIPDALYGARGGTTDSEAIFLAAFAHGLEKDPVSALEATLARILALPGVTEAGAEPLRFSAVISNGKTLHAFRWASDGRPPSLYCREEGQGLLVASEPCEGPSGEWTALPPGCVLEVGRDGAAHMRAFDPARVTAPARSRAA
ncbi:class II glutamine amidotransferase [Aureimonas mangrovi]|uniref:class II glutamine amidotransferase n=1 Tax=Aureimonas mangrovi TaxID=2758041 RepID=UPI00163DD988|nr:class II glutamine amidotransferase [Aureimonas mangrovi]